MECTAIITYWLDVTFMTSSTTKYLRNMANRICWGLACQVSGSSAVWFKSLLTEKSISLCTPGLTGKLHLAMWGILLLPKMSRKTPLCNKKIISLLLNLGIYCMTLVELLNAIRIKKSDEKAFKYALISKYDQMRHHCMSISFLWLWRPLLGNGVNDFGNRIKTAFSGCFVIEAELSDS